MSAIERLSYARLVQNRANYILNEINIRIAEAIEKNDPADCYVEIPIRDIPDDAYPAVLAVLEKAYVLEFDNTWLSVYYR